MTTTATQRQAKGKKASFFKMRAQLLEQGRTNTPLARTETKMRHDDAELVAVDHELGVKRMARLIAADAQIDVAHPLDRETGQ